MTELRVDGWARIFDTEHGGQVRHLDDREVHLETPDGQCWVVPREVAVAEEEPAVEDAAFAILDILREYDASWGQNDTTQLRRRLVLKVRSVLAEHARKDRPT